MKIKNNLKKKKEDRSSYTKKPSISSYSLRILKALNKETKKDSSFPSKNNKRVWVYTNLQGDKLRVQSKQKDEDDGKWLIFIRESEIDKIWHKVMELYESGKLIGSGGAKCSTQYSKHINPEGKYVIVIYCLNNKEVKHNRNILREFAGINWRIPYKLSIDTGNKYYVRGDKFISKYFE